MSEKYFCENGLYTSQYIKPFKDHNGGYDSLTFNEIFKPTKRFTVCMSSDWRNYQKIAKNYDPEYIEQLFQNFYNLDYIYL